MPRDARPRVTLAEPQQALFQYLQGLLNESLVGSPPFTEPISHLTTPPPALSPSLLVTEACPCQPAAAPSPVAVPSIGTLPESVITPSPRRVPGPPLIPDWGQQPFQALGFAIAGLRLSLPLGQLQGIARWDGGLTCLPGMPPWQLGLMPFRGQQVAVLDLARLLLSQPDQAAPGGGYLLLLQGSPWGLACEHLLTPMWVHPQAVRWRRSPGRPPCIAGVLAEGLLPILDVDELLARIAGA